MGWSRRGFLQKSLACSSCLSGFTHLTGCTGSGFDPILPPSTRFGPLLTDSNGVLDLPAGFSYNIISRTGDLMTDGFVVPHYPDGAATFDTDNGLTLLVRNHEIDPGAADSLGAFGQNDERLDAVSAAALFDTGRGNGPCLGGTTTIVYDTELQQVLSSHLSLAGTLRNCSGGVTPWGTWLTCEEYFASVGDKFARNHGYVFEVPATQTPQLNRATPLVAMGRFRREAVAVHPSNGVVYQTEDVSGGLLYRYIPDIVGDLAAGGRLQVLGLVNDRYTDTRNQRSVQITIGERLATTWLDLDQPDSPAGELRVRGTQMGAALFARNEGLSLIDGDLYICTSNGGAAGTGQIWRYQPSTAEGTPDESLSPGFLSLYFESNAHTPIDHVDTLLPSPWGDILITEDGHGQQHLAGLSSSGELYALARNRLSDSEITGPVFALDGSTLFLSLQKDGLTLAITGPWLTANS